MAPSRTMREPGLLVLRFDRRFSGQAASRFLDTHESGCEDVVLRRSAPGRFAGDRFGRRPCPHRSAGPGGNGRGRRRTGRFARHPGGCGCCRRGPDQIGRAGARPPGGGTPRAETPRAAGSTCRHAGIPANRRSRHVEGREGARMNCAGGRPTPPGRGATPAASFRPFDGQSSKLTSSSRPISFRWTAKAPTYGVLDFGDG